MIHASRRKILGLFAAAPVSVPVVLKGAAVKAGLASIATAAADMDHGGVASDYTAGPEASWDGQLKWLRHRIACTNTEHQRFHRRQRAEQSAHRLNPNLSSLRSISPAIAYQIEVDRQIKLLEERDRASANLELVEALRQKALG